MEIPKTYVAQQSVVTCQTLALKFLKEILQKHGIKYSVDEQDRSVVVDSTSTFMNDQQIAELFEEANKRALS